jgi:hypothetical protein
MKMFRESSLFRVADSDINPFKRGQEFESHIYEYGWDLCAGVPTGIPKRLQVLAFAYK